jgi:hypothetical protein
LPIDRRGIRNELPHTFHTILDKELKLRNFAQHSTHIFEYSEAATAKAFRLAQKEQLRKVIVGESTLVEYLNEYVPERVSISIQKVVDGDDGRIFFVHFRRVFRTD